MEITIQKPDFDGAVVTFANATDTGDFATLTKDTGYDFRIVNGSGGDITVTVTAVRATGSELGALATFDRASDSSRCDRSSAFKSSTGSLTTDSPHSGMPAG